MLKSFYNEQQSAFHLHRSNVIFTRCRINELKLLLQKNTLRNQMRHAHQSVNTGSRSFQVSIRINNVSPVLCSRSIRRVNCDLLITPAIWVIVHKHGASFSAGRWDKV
jgi:hypothetical protein